MEVGLEEKLKKLTKTTTA